MESNHRSRHNPAKITVDLQPMMHEHEDSTVLRLVAIDEMVANIFVENRL